jgi:hypothetical protein
MRKTIGFVSALALMAGLAASATGPKSMVRQALSPISGANAVEHQSAINATTNNYAVIAPTFYNQALDFKTPHSFIRFYNGAGLAGSTTTSRFSITIVGDKSGAAYGSSFNLDIPHMASIQYGIHELVSRAGVTPGTFNGGDTGYVVYVQNSDKEAGFQHAVYDGNSNLFENMSMCNTNINQQMSTLHNELVLTNIHTSVGPNKIGQKYPSTIRVHNYYNTPINYTLTVFNAGVQNSNGTIPANAGTQICKIAGNMVAANTTMTIPVTSIEGNAACSSITSADYLNVVISDASGGAPNAVVGQTIAVLDFQGNNTSMTPTCAVNAVSTQATGGGGGGVIVSPYL